MLVNCLIGGHLVWRDQTDITQDWKYIYKGGIACIKASVVTTVQKGRWEKKDLGEAVSFESTLNAFYFKPMILLYNM